MTCLDQRTRELGALTDLLTHAAPPLLAKAANMAAQLGDIAQCADVPALQMTEPPPRDANTRRRVDALRSELAAVGAIELSQQITPALIEREQALVEATRAAGFRPLTADALLQLGYAHDDLEQFALGHSALEEAIWTGIETRHDRVVVLAASELASIVGRVQRNYVEGNRWGKLAAATVQRLDDAKVKTRVETIVGALALGQGQLTDARWHYMTARWPWPRKPAPHPTAWPKFSKSSAASTSRRGSTTRRRRITKARTTSRCVRTAPMIVICAPSCSTSDRSKCRAVLSAKRKRRWERALVLDEQGSPPNTFTANTLEKLGFLLLNRQQPDQALANFRRAVALRIQLLGPQHPDVALGQASVASALLALHKPKEAEALLVSALDVLSHADGADEETVSTLVKLADNEQGLGQTDSALSRIERGLAIAAAKLGPHHRWVPSLLVARGNILLAAHRSAHAALADGQRALPLFEAAFGADAPAVVDALALMGRAEMALGDHAAAIAPFERALRVTKDRPEFAGERAEIESILARARAHHS